ncbi:glycosyltransferase [Paenibacillus sp. Y412MC10]|uniref:glycosyltransferase family protein n=1 Tax=Geobacillus sp. (strain Y412MC10) TaxID=481743 RepID=UPI000178952B|nr:glycosyltransferase [Paenibacillus sp. Y412MC10]ACX63749.1 Glycosyltransferase-like protein [Paenibacillus sp. Y412MC10]
MGKRGKRGDINVLIVGSEKIASYKIGIEQPLRHLEKMGVCDFDVRSDDEMDRSRLAEADIVLFFRTVQPEAYKYLEMAREMGKRTVYVIDDHFIAMSPGSDMGRYYHDSSRRKTYVKFLKNAQTVKVASSFFAKHLETHFSPQKIVYFPGSVDFSVISGLKKNRKEEGKVVIGYEGGKKQVAFEPVIGALHKIIGKYGDKLRIEFCGYVPEELREKPQVFTESYDENYKNFLKRLYRSNWDIGLAPLERTLLHDCKSNNKFREYSACRIPGIYSSSPAYEEWVAGKENGLIVSGESDDWYEAMVQLIEQPELRQSIAEHAEQVAWANFSVEACAERWRSQILMSE